MISCGEGTCGTLAIVSGGAATVVMATSTKLRMWNGELRNPGDTLLNSSFGILHSSFLGERLVRIDLVFVEGECHLLAAERHVLALWKAFPFVGHQDAI